MDWTAVISAVGGILVTFGAVWVRVMTTRHANQVAREEAERKAKKEQTAEQRKDHKDTIAELYEIMEVLRVDNKEYREQVHQVRNELNEFRLKLALCEAERAATAKEMAEQHRQINLMADALTKAGIFVDLRPVRGGS